MMAIEKSKVDFVLNRNRDETDKNFYCRICNRFEWDMEKSNKPKNQYLTFIQKKMKNRS